MSLTARLKERIAAQGSITVAEYMDAALSDPQDGYYMRKDPFGLEGDFITSPEISQIFGELIGLWCADIWLQMNSPEIDIIELGPGRGTLMKDFLRATCHVPNMHAQAQVHLVEMSPVLRAIQQENLSSKYPFISWHENLPADNGKPLLLIANEFFDALPIHQYLNGEERKISWQEEAFAFQDDGAGEITETCPSAQHIMQEIGNRIAKNGGAALIIDYGYEEPAKGDTLQAVYQHQYHPFLEQPGKADLTAHVNFSSLARAVSGANVAPLLTQGEFLQRMGGRVRVQQLSQNATGHEQREAIAKGFDRLIGEMGELFKVLAVTSPQVLPPVF